MENPREDVKDVIRGLVCKPTLEQQEEVLRRYYTPDVEFFHFNINDKGRSHLIANFQMTELLVNYQDVTFHHIAYDQDKNSLAVHMSVEIRPLPKFFFQEYLRFHLLFELEERVDKLDGRKKQYIRVQRDFFLRDPVIQVLPIVGTIYNSDQLRLFAGRISASLFRALRSIYRSVVPSGIQKSLFHLWLLGPHGKPSNPRPANDVRLVKHAEDTGSRQGADAGFIRAARADAVHLSATGRT